MAYFLKKKAHVISRGEGKNTVAIALSQADPLIETVSVFLSSTLYTLDTYVYAKYIIRGFYPYSFSLYCIEFSMHNCVWRLPYHTREFKISNFENYRRRTLQNTQQVMFHT